MHATQQYTHQRVKGFDEKFKCNKVNKVGKSWDQFNENSEFDQNLPDMQYILLDYPKRSKFNEKELTRRAL